MSRDSTLDIMKAIGIMFVVFGHIYSNSRFIYLFHMPLFFIISGATMVYSLNNSIKHKFRTIMMPYFIFSILSFGYWVLLESKFRPIHETPIFMGYLGTLNIKVQQFINIFIAENGTNSFAYNIVLWFLPCLFIGNCIYLKIKATKLEIPIAIGLITLYYLWVEKQPCMPWCLNIAILTVPLITIGYHFYKPILKYLKDIKLSFLVLLISLVALIYIYKTLPININMMNNQIPSFYLFYILSILGYIMVLSTSCIINKINKSHNILVYIGKNSLIIMGIHEPLKRILLTIISKLINTPTDIIRSDILMSLVTMVMVIAICLPLSYLIYHYLPWMIGKPIQKISC